jgi:hypothetical protein
LSDDSDDPDEEDYENKGGFQLGGMSVTKESAKFSLVDTQEGLASLLLLKKGKVHYRTTELVEVSHDLVALPEKSFYGREDGLLVVPRYADLTLLAKYTRDLELGKAKDRTLCRAYFLHWRSSGSTG